MEVALHKVQKNKMKIKTAADVNPFKMLWGWKFLDSSSLESASSLPQLVHENVVTHYVKSEIAVDVDDNDLDESLLEDDSILLDGDTSTVSILSSPASDQISSSGSSTSKATRLLWRLSMVYSPTWMVPVLYFTVQNASSGSILSRPQVMDLISHKKNDNSKGRGSSIHHDDDDSGDYFLSQEMHPVSGVPSFFLHPCQTATRMKELIHSSSSSSQKNNHHLYLWTCLSLLLPTLGFEIPSTIFTAVQNELEADHKDCA